MSRARAGPSARILLSTDLRHAAILHFLGYPPGRRPPEPIGRLIGGLLAEARPLVRACGAYRSLPVHAAVEVGLEPIEASGLVIGLVTIGPAIETRVSELAGQGATTAALVLDAMGSAAVEAAADRLGARIVTGKAPGGRGMSGAAPAGVVSTVSCRISPGYGRWPLAAQARLFDRLPHAALDVTLLPSSLMVPRKSISFAMWMGAGARPVAGLSGCGRCALVRCRYRRPLRHGSDG